MNTDDRWKKRFIELAVFTVIFIGIGFRVMQQHYDSELYKLSTSHLLTETKYGGDMATILSNFGMKVDCKGLVVQFNIDFCAAHNALY